MPAAQYKPLQRGYLSWVTARLKAGASVDAMNSELKAANLLLSPSEPDDVDAIFDSHAGYLTEIEIRPTGASRDVIAIRFGTYTGSACNEDDTVALYHREPFQLLTIINAESSYAHGYILREVSVGNEDAKGRLIASAWVAFNCTSNWNGNIFRIDVARAGVLKTVLEKGVGAFFDDELRIGIEAEGVTFRYSSGIADTDVIVRKAIARYEVHGGHATRVAPIAPSYGGFIDEWLKLEDAEVAQWSSPAASRRHHELSAQLTQELFILRGAWNCPGGREIEVESDESKKVFVFRIFGSTIEQMRMEAVSDRPSPGCQEINIRKDLTSILSEPRSL